MVRIVLKITFLKLRYPKGVTGRVPLCPIMALGISEEKIMIMMIIILLPPNNFFICLFIYVNCAPDENNRPSEHII